MQSYLESKEAAVNHYSVLNLDSNASAANIREAYLRLAVQFHPDINKDENAASKFNDIKNAYKILSNAESRSSYDNSIAKKLTGKSISIPTESKQNNTSHKTPSTALVSMQTYNFSDLLENAGLSSDGFLKLAQNSIETAMTIIQSEKYSKVLSHANQISLALIYWPVCEYLIAKEDFRKNLTYSNLEELLKKYKKKFADVLKTNNDLNALNLAYKELQAYKKSNSKDIANFSEFKKIVECSKITNDELKLLNKKNKSLQKFLEEKPEQKNENTVEEKKTECVSKINIFTIKSEQECAEALKDIPEVLKLNYFNLKILMLKFKIAAMTLVGRDIVVKHNGDGPFLFKLTELYGNDIRAIIKKNYWLNVMLESYLSLKNFKTGDLNCLEIGTRKSNSNLNDAAFKELLKNNQELSLCWLSNKRDYSLYFDEIIKFDFDKVRKLIFADPNNFESFKDDQVSTIIFNFKYPCLKYLEWKKSRISGEFLSELVSKWGSEALEIVMQNPHLRKRLQAFELLEKAQRNSINLVESVTTEVNDTSPTMLYQMGLNFLNGQSDDKFNLAATYFSQAAAGDHELAFKELIKLEEVINPSFLIIIAEIFDDRTLSFHDSAKAETYYRRACITKDKKVFEKLHALLITEIEIGGVTLSENANYLALKKFFLSLPLCDATYDYYARQMCDVCTSVDNLSEELVYLQRIRKPDNDELYRLGHVLFSEITDKQKTIILNSKSTISTEELNAILSEPERIAERLNIGMPTLLIAATNSQDADYKTYCIVPMLKDLSKPELLNNEVAKLIGVDSELSQRLGNLYYQICLTHPEILIDKIIAINLVKLDLEAKKLFELALQSFNSVSGEVYTTGYLLLFAAMYQGSQLASVILDSFNKNYPNETPNSFIEEIESYYSLANDLLSLNSALNKEDQVGILSSLHHYFNQKNHNEINFSITHIHARLGDIGKLSELVAKFNFCEEDFHKNNVLEVLYQHHPDKLNPMYQLIKDNPKATYNFYNALMFAMAKSNDALPEMSNLLDTMQPDEYSSLPVNQLMMTGLMHSALKNNVKIAELLLDKIPVSQQVVVIQSILNKFLKPKHLSIYTKQLSVPIKDLFLKRVQDIQSFANDLLAQVITKINSQPRSLFTSRKVHKATSEFIDKLTTIRQAQDSNIFLEFQKSLQVFTENIANHNASREYASLNDILKSNLPTDKTPINFDNLFCERSSTPIERPVM